MEKNENNIVYFNDYIHEVDGNLALDNSSLNDIESPAYLSLVDKYLGEEELEENNEIEESFEEPIVRRLVVLKSDQKIFMGCWQGCNEDSEGDGC